MTWSRLDNVCAGRLATEYLLDLGHSRIAVTGGRDNIITGEDRLRGYFEAHAARGVAVQPRLQIAGRFLQTVAHDSTLALMRAPEPPTAIFSLSNMMTLGVLNALRELKLSVPTDVSVISIDDFDYADIMNPPPTVVAAPVTEMAQSAIDQLFQQILSKSKPTSSVTQFMPELIVRERLSISNTQ
ncbi:substrate-binding domain-containing protein [Devosia algicola]|uniref:Substrate-binding domain-containing protein n=1 Tax=Devosia algicola TaxID=3026418 RepID=A0ABY7YL70_9HYPH|nr:substrate-binding domain-containing protein [Devosia algicola]WDR01939.1 substrate-binding domain-containing protein [Devosia algicola]